MSIIAEENVNITFTQFNSFKAVSLTMLKRKLTHRGPPAHINASLVGHSVTEPSKQKQKGREIKQPHLPA